MTYRGTQPYRHSGWRGRTGARSLLTSAKKVRAFYYTHSCMPTIRYKLRGRCSHIPTTLTPSTLRPASIPSSAPLPLRPQAAPRARLHKYHTHILRMDVRHLSEEHASEGDGLKLTNRLNESRSPYVSASAIAKPKVCNEAYYRPYRFADT
jgi:hypothetical protein